MITGTAAVPLLLVKLWTVFPRLFLRPPRGARRLLLEVLERGSIAVLVAAAIFQLASGLANAAQWYPWSFSFRSTHYALAWVAIGALVVHIAVKLPIIRDVLTSDLDDTTHDRATANEPGALSRRGLLRTTWGAAGVAVLATAGSTVPILRDVSVLRRTLRRRPRRDPRSTSPRPLRRSPPRPPAPTTGSRWRTPAARSPSPATTCWRCRSRPAPSRSRASRAGAPAAAGPASGSAGCSTLVEAPDGAEVRVVSLQESGPFRQTVLQGNFADDDRTLLALALNGETLSIDHGYPARLIAPNRPGVLQTKWVTRLEVDLMRQRRGARSAS